MKSQATKKFISYLNNEYNEIKEVLVLVDILKTDKVSEKEIEKLEESLVEIDNLIKIISIESENFIKTGEIFRDFDILSNYLLISDLKIREYLDLISEMIQKNIKANLLTRIPLCIDIKYLKRYQFKNFNKNEVMEFIKTNTFQTLLDTEDKYLTSDEISKKYELLEYFKNNTIDLTDFINYHKMFQEHYLNKLDNYTKEDSDKIIKALSNLKINHEVIKKISVILEKDSEKRTKQNQNPKKFNFQIEQKNTEKVLLTDKEYKAIKKDLKTYYDFYNNQVIRPLTYEEVIYCVSKMIQLGEDNKRIIEFLLNTLDNSKITLSNYLEEELNRLKFYQEKYLLQEKIQVFEQYYKEMLKANKDNNIEDYKFWRSSLLEEYKRLQQHIPENYEYEIYLGKKLLKRKEENT